MQDGIHVTSGGEEHHFNGCLYSLLILLLLTVLEAIEFVCLQKVQVMHDYTWRNANEGILCHLFCLIWYTNLHMSYF